MSDLALAKCPRCGLITSMPSGRFRAGETLCGIAGCRGKLTREKWRERRIGQNIGGAPLRARVYHRDLRAGRREAAPEIGSPCERCGDWTEDIQCCWICPKCAAFFDGMRRLSEHQNAAAAQRKRAGRE